MRWKNGGGETIEIAAHPQGADLSDFIWRVSIARVETDGPFSRFENVDRTLTVLSGAGIALSIDGLGRHDLTSTSPPLRFAADAPTSASLHGGPIIDLNVMTRRGVATHRVERSLLGPASEITPAAQWTLVLPQGPVEVRRSGGPAETLIGEDALLLEAGDPAIHLSADRPTATLLVWLDLASRT